jgi:Fe-S-cluster-containing dehydrogenase component
VWEKRRAPERLPEVPLRLPDFFAGTAPPPGSGAVELWAWPHINLFDGRLANRGWMQEVPEPAGYIGWGSWIDLHPRTARALGVSEGDVAELSAGRGVFTAPVRVTDEVIEGVAAIPFGQGHTALGRNAAGTGSNAFSVAALPAAGSLFGFASFRRAGKRDVPAYGAATPEQHGRGLLRWVPLPEARGMRPGEGGEEVVLPLPESYDPRRDLYPRRGYRAHRWAMVIDLQRCIGCGACAAACYAENNVAVTGREELRKGRHMAWLRVVPMRDEEAPLRRGWLPLLCQHCDAAPCEPVCPVFAAVHNEEGLNAQVYNRCIGTRYCSNNCPYKVRRFNWFDYEWPGPLERQLNPEVSVRSRGVMEKCTFCVQRIREAQYRASREKRRIRDGEIQPACVQTCPTRVFAFGDLLDPGSTVSRLIRFDPRRYQLLKELRTKPAVVYLKRIRQG